MRRHGYQSQQKISCSTTGDLVKQQQMVDKNYCKRRVPQRVQLLDPTAAKIGHVVSPLANKKISMTEFIQIQRVSPRPDLLKKVENPYDFASKVNSEEFLKQYYASLIRMGLVTPRSEQEQGSLAKEKKLKMIKMRFQKKKEGAAVIDEKMKRSLSSFRLEQQPIYLHPPDYGSTRLTSRQSSRQTSLHQKDFRSKSPQQRDVQTGPTDGIADFELGYSYKNTSRIKSAMIVGKSRSQEQSLYAVQLAEGPYKKRINRLDPQLFFNFQFTKGLRLKKGNVFTPSKVKPNPDLQRILTARYGRRLSSHNFNLQ